MVFKLYFHRWQSGYFQYHVRGSNPFIGKFYVKHCLLSTVLKRRKYRKRGRDWPISKNIFSTVRYLLDTCLWKKALTFFLLMRNCLKYYYSDKELLFTPAKCLCLHISAKTRLFSRNE